MQIQFATMSTLFDSESVVPRGTMKKDVLAHFKQFTLTGVPDSLIYADLDGDEDSDIIVKRIDPEDALGTPVFNGVESYFDDLSQQLYEPGEDEVE